MLTARMPSITRLVLAVAVVMVVSNGSRAADHEVLNPATYTSPSGRYEIFVDPSAMEGRGPATYSMKHDGIEIWADQRPYSLWDTRVTDQGAVVGYAYQGGVHVGGNHGTQYSGLKMVVLAPDGRELLIDPASSHDADTDKDPWSGSDSPRVLGMIVDAALDRFTVFIPLAGNDDPIVWWTYRISTGEKLGDVVPAHPQSKERGFQRIVLAELLPGTSLSIVQWYIYESANGKQTKSAALSLLDPHGREIWSLDLHGEYDLLGEDWDWYWDMVGAGLEQTAVGQRSFSFRSYSHSSRLSFVVEVDPKADAGWRVVESARVEDHMPVIGRGLSQSDIDLIELEPLGSIKLEDPDSASSPIGGIHDFAIDPKGNLGFVRGNGNGTVRFILVEPTGEIVSDVVLDLPQDDKAALPLVAPVSHDRWVLLRTSYAEGVGTNAWWLDPMTGALDALESVDSNRVESIIPTGDGGFLVLASSYMVYPIQSSLVRYDRNGQAVEHRQLPDRFAEQKIRAVAWLGSNGFALLTDQSRTIEYLDTDWTHLRSVKQTSMLMRDLQGSLGLVADPSGGLMMHEYGISPPVYRFDADGKIVATIYPRFPDGRKFRINSAIRIAPDGALWTTDRHSLLRLNSDGMVDQVVGHRPSDDSLDEIRALAIVHGGEIYAVNGRTAAVHVFSGDGTPLRVCRPLPTDFATDFGSGAITVDGDGNIYYRMDRYTSPSQMSGYFMLQKSGFLILSGECERIRFKYIGVDGISKGWMFKPGSSESWVLGYEQLYLLDSKYIIKKMIKKRPDGTWLQRVHNGAVGPDGSLAALAGVSGRGMLGPIELCIYDANGGPIATMPLGSVSVFARVAFNGSTVVIADQRAIVLYNVDGRALRKFEPTVADGGRRRHWMPYISPDGTELWLSSGDSTTLHRYKLP